MKGLGTRVHQLEQQQPVSCDTCRFWNGAIIVTIDDAGNETGRSRPEECPACGRHVPVERVLGIVGVDWDGV